MKWLNWLQPYCNQTVSVSFLSMVKTGKINNKQKWKKKYSNFFSLLTFLKEAFWTAEGLIQLPQTETN